MAELLLRFAINLAHKLILDDGSDSTLSSEVQKLRGLSIQGSSYVEDAEQRQLTNQGVKQWLEDFKDVCYDMIDVLDEWNLLQTKLQMQKKVLGLSSFSLFFLPPIRQFIVRHDTAQKIRNLSEKMEALCRLGDILKLVRDRLGATFTNIDLSSSLVSTPVVIGLDSEKKTLISELISEASQEQDFRCLCICGMGGIGKSTLAQLVYNSKEVQNHFELMAWVCVSVEFDLIRILRIVIECLTSEVVSMNEFNLDILMLRLRDIIRGKRFLLVLDDLWYTGVESQEILRKFCDSGAAGSAVLITTRLEVVACAWNSARIMLKSTLSDEDSWAMFKHFVFGNSTDEREIDPELKAIVSKCKGLPLAVKVIANLLRIHGDKKDLLRVLETGMTFLALKEQSVRPALMLSYIYLNPALKQCLLYCSIFPNDHPVDVDKLVRLWMAQDYLASEENDMEMNGNLCYEELLSRSFIQFLHPNRDHNGNLLCSINGVILEFIQSLAEMECSVIHVNQKRKAKMDLSSQNGRHWTINIVGQASFPIFVGVPEKVLTLMIISEYASIDPTSLSNLLCRFKRLRTLDMSRCLIRKLPLEVGKLLHLRYLDLSYNSDLKELPEEICDLSLLQSLNLNGCDSLQKLPNKMEKLIFLRHLELLWTKCLSYLPKGIGSLTPLRTLSRFFGSRIDSSMACNLGDLGKLRCLQGYISIDGLGCVTDVALAEIADLKHKEGLSSMELWFSGVGSDHCNDGAVLEALQPPPNLKSLGIFYYRERFFPRWMEAAVQLTHIMLSDCSGCEILPPLGKLPFLESVEIRNMINLKKIGFDFLGIESGSGNGGEEVFPQLKKLHFHNLTNWVEWDEITVGVEHVTIMPKLGSLSILKCTKIKAVPDYIERIDNLSRLIEECPLLNDQKLEKNWED